MALAQGFTSPPTQDEQIKDERRREEKKVSPFLGKTYYIMFGHYDCAKYKIFQSPLRADSFYVSDTPQSFVVQKVTDGSHNRPFFEVLMQDGTVGYIPTTGFEVSNSKLEFDLKNGCIYDIPPDEIDSRIAIYEEKRDAKKKKEHAKTAKIEAQFKKMRQHKVDIAKRPGAIIGMTTREVIDKTSWGEPKKVNRTISGDGVREQWVYGDSEYLYFMNDRLTSIQTSR